MTESRGSEPKRLPLTVTHLHEYLYCPRITFFDQVMHLPRNDDSRELVQRGRRAHHEREKINPNYLRKRLGVVERRFAVPLASARLGLRAEVDEVLILENGEYAPLDYKFAEYDGRVYRHLAVQSIAYGMMLEEQFGVTVSRGWLCYIRSKHRLVEVVHTKEDKEAVAELIGEVLRVITPGIFPEATKSRNKCRDCCYRNVCIR